MIFKQTEFKGVYLIETEPIADERGFFARSFCRKEFETHGLNPCVAQCNVSYNRRKGTLRGMHYQVAPHSEAKLVSCLFGSIYDVIIDLRPNSATYRKWFAVELRAHEVGKMIYVPEGFAHGFQTLEDDTKVFYQISTFYEPGSARGIRWDDPAFGIKWPEGLRTLSDRDKSYPDFA